MESTALRRALVGASVCALTVVGLGAGAASAGEITGNGQLKEVKANSICAYSGLNDGAAEEGVRVQNYGTDKKLFDVPEFLHPGNACNGATGLLASGAPE